MCKFTDRALVSSKRKASYFANYEPDDDEAKADGRQSAKPSDEMDRAGSLVSLEFARLWSIDSNSADFLGLSHDKLVAPTQVSPGVAEDRCKRECGCSMHSACPPQGGSSTPATSPFSSSEHHPAESPHLASTATAAAAFTGGVPFPSAFGAGNSAEPSSFAEAMLPEACDMWDFTPQECPEQELLQDFGGVPPCPALSEVAAYPALQPQQYNPLLEQQQQARQQQYLQQQQPSSCQFEPQPAWPVDATGIAALPATCNPVPAATTPGHAPAFAAAAVAAPPAVAAAPAPCPAGAVGGTGDFELCEKFYGSVMRLKDYAASVGIERLNPTGVDAPEGVLAGLLEHVRTVSKVCIDLFKPECPAVLSGLYKSTVATQPEVAAQRWRRIIGQMRLVEQQVLAVLAARDRHLVAISAVYQERADLALVVHELVASTGTPCFGSGAQGVDLGRQGFLYCAHAAQGLQRATEGLQVVLVRERDLVMKLYLELMYFVLTPVQAAIFIMEAFPHHIDVLAMANVLAAC